MTILYLDVTAGIAGDMTVAALLDLGVPLEHLHNELAKLGLPSGAFRLSEQKVQRGGLTGRQFEVHLPHEHSHHDHDHGHGHHHHHHRRYSDIRQMIASSSLSEQTKELAQRIFLKLAEAEAKAHQVAVDDVTFHEVGAVDSIVDIVGTAIGMEYLGIETISCSAVPLGGGFVETAHGRLPVPAPATSELLKGLVVHGRCSDGERVTPTGAAILAALATPLDQMPVMQVTAIGHGAGSKDFADCPNIMRAFLGQASEQSADKVLELSCNLDDVTPEVIGYTVQRLLASGALDVWTSAIQMKKQRPGVQLSLLCMPDLQSALAGIIMDETATLGLRVQWLERIVQRRRIEERQTRWGRVRYKVADCSLKPEFEDCCRIAREQGLPLHEVQRTLQKEYSDE